MNVRYIVAIFGQRKESYDGEFAPEFLDGIDDFSEDENPNYIQETLAKYESKGEFESLKVVKLKFDNLLLEAAFSIPNIPTELES